MIPESDLSSSLNSWRTRRMPTSPTFTWWSIIFRHTTRKGGGRERERERERERGGWEGGVQSSLLFSALYTLKNEFVKKGWEVVEGKKEWSEILKVHWVVPTSSLHPDYDAIDDVGRSVRDDFNRFGGGEGRQTGFPVFLSFYYGNERGSEGRKKERSLDVAYDCVLDGIHCLLFPSRLLPSLASSVCPFSSPLFSFLIIRRRE